MTNTNEVEVIAELKYDETNNKIRLEWWISNSTQDTIRIHAYWCPFYKDGVLLGVYVNGVWIDDERPISSERIKSTLFPDEERKIVWSYVDPIYYGIKSRGKWRYSVKIYYSYEGAKELIPVQGDSDEIHIRGEDVHIPDRLDDFTHPDIIRKLVEAFSNIRDFAESKEIQDAILTPRGVAFIIPDAILRTDESILLVEFRVHLLQTDLERMKRYLMKVREKAEEMNLEIKGVILVLDELPQWFNPENYDDIIIIRLEEFTA